MNAVLSRYELDFYREMLIVVYILVTAALCKPPCEMVPFFCEL